jgi:predicted nucleotidyltransferase component of viral defense system
MILFDRLIDQAVSNQIQYSALRTVVEKEVLHHDILRIMNVNGLLKSLTFIGGTCLRDCYGSNRLSEDLDFTGGIDFNEKNFDELADVFKESFLRKYDLPVEVRVPKENNSSIKTWKLLIQTRPERHLPAQRIHIDINKLPSYDVSPRMILNNYGIDLGTSGLIIRAESRTEIITDKYIALGLRLNRIKNRDLWDIVWLYQNGFKPDANLLLKKLDDYEVGKDYYIESMIKRIFSLSENPEGYTDFKKEMVRFLPTKIVTETIASLEFWTYLKTIISETWEILKTEIIGKNKSKQFLM